jgi:bacteriorhodopsin
VVTNLANWCSWSVTVPLLTYSVLVPNFGRAPSRTELIAIISNALTIQAGLAMQFDVSYGWTWLFFLLSIFFFFVALTSMYLSNVALTNKLVKADESPPNRKMQILRFTTKMKSELTLTFGLLLPCFPLVYCLAATGVLTPDSTLVGYLFLNVFTKGFVALVVLDAHIIGHLESQRYQVEQEREWKDSSSAFFRLILQ